MAMILYFAAGVFTSGMSTIYVRFVGSELAFAASIITFLNVLIGTLVLVDIVSNISTVGILGTAMYALGTAVGTYVAIKIRKPRMSNK